MAVPGKLLCDMGDLRNTSIEARPLGYFNSAIRLTFDDTITIADYGGRRVQQFNADGDFKREMKTGVSLPRDVDVLPTGDLIVLDTFLKRVLVMSPFDSRLIQSITAHAGGAPFVKPVALAASARRVFVLDQDAVHVYE